MPPPFGQISLTGKKRRSLAFRDIAAFCKKKVQEKRLELSWYCYHTDLNRTRLPIPPFLHNTIYYNGFGKKVNPFFGKSRWKSKF